LAAITKLPRISDCDGEGILYYVFGIGQVANLNGNLHFFQKKIISQINSQAYNILLQYNSIIFNKYFDLKGQK